MRAPGDFEFSAFVVDIPADVKLDRDLYGLSLVHFFLRTETCARFLQRSLLSCLACFAFVFIPDGTGCAKFAVDVGVAALKTVFTQIDAVLGAHVAGFSV